MELVLHELDRIAADPTGLQSAVRAHRFFCPYGSSDRFLRSPGSGYIRATNPRKLPRTLKSPENLLAGKRTNR